MSAWIVTAHLIDALVDAAIRPSSITGKGLWYLHNGRTRYCVKPDPLGRLLLAECVKSVAYRYQDHTDATLPGSSARPDDYHYRPPAELPIETLLKAISCYEYQSCEHPGWKESEAFAFCQALREHLVTELPGYQDAPWGIDDELRDQDEIADELPSRQQRRRSRKAA